MIVYTGLCSIDLRKTGFNRVKLTEGSWSWDVPGFELFVRSLGEIKPSEMQRFDSNN